MPKYSKYSVNNNQVNIIYENVNHEIVNKEPIKLSSNNEGTQIEYLENENVKRVFSISNNSISMQIIPNNATFIYSIKKGATAPIIKHIAKFSNEFECGKITKNTYYVKQKDINNGPMLRQFKIEGFFPNPVGINKVLNIFLFSNWFIGEAIIPFICGIINFE